MSEMKCESAAADRRTVRSHEKTPEAATQRANSRGGATWKAAATLLIGLGLVTAGEAQRAARQPDLKPDPAIGATDALRASFLHPPAESRIMMRWWWFGPAVTHEEIDRELEEMKRAGVGGVELTSLYAQALDDSATGFQNAAYASPQHVAALRYAVTKARALGLRVDLTLGSGWPYGGPEIPVNLAAGGLRVERIAVRAGTTEIMAPAVGAGEQPIEAFLVNSTATKAERAGAQSLAAPLAGRYHFPAAQKDRELIAFISSRTGMTVKRPSVGAEGFVLDHYDRAALNEHLNTVGERLIGAFGAHPPDAVFSDSLEVYASDWTPRLLEEFQRRRGYDLRPYLLALVTDIGPQTAAVRHDWGETLTELVDENYLRPLASWAHAHGTKLRAQVYGFPPVNLASNALVDQPEGEGKATFRMWREFSDTRWAASAGHLFHRNVISSETWTWLDSPAFRATPLDMKAEADLHFVQGINQLVGHGWPYSPPEAGEPGWRMYAAAALNAHNPWFFAMPELTAYLQRVSWALRLGKPANDVALLLPEDDARASFHAVMRRGMGPTSELGFNLSGSNVTIDEQMGKRLGEKLMGRILDAGFNPDLIDADALDQVGIPYRALVMPGVDRIPVTTYERILEFARRGGVVIATRRMPATAPGLVDAAQQSARIQAISRELFGGGVATARFLPDEAQLGETLAGLAKPDVQLVDANEQTVKELGWIHRRLQRGNLYFVANTSNHALDIAVRFRDRGAAVERWNPFDGTTKGVEADGAVPLHLAAYDSRLIFFPKDKAVPTKPDLELREIGRQDLSHAWHVQFERTSGTPDTGIERAYARLHSWTEDEATRNFSGHAVYTRDVQVNGLHRNGSTRYTLEFGVGKALPQPVPPGEHNMKAYLDAPVREVAEVFVNGRRAGVVWRPPWRLDVTQWMQNGVNHLRIVVGNTAINEMAGEPQPDLRLLRARYGKLFEPQDMDDLKPLPSGLLGPVTLVRMQRQPATTR